MVMLRLPIPLLLKYPTRYGSSVGAHSFTLEEEGSGKVRGQSVDITTKGPDHSVEVWANFVPNIVWRQCEGVELTYHARHEA